MCNLRLDSGIWRMKQQQNFWVTKQENNNDQTKQYHDETINVLYTVSQKCHTWTDLINIGRNVTNIVGYQMMLYLIFSLQLTSDSVLTCRTANLETLCLFALRFCQQTHKRIQIIAWSQMNRPSFPRWLNACIRHDPGKEHNILPSVAHTLNVYQVQHNVVRCVKRKVKVNGQ